MKYRYGWGNIMTTAIGSYVTEKHSLLDLIDLRMRIHKSLLSAKDYLFSKYLPDQEGDGGWIQFLEEKNKNIVPAVASTSNVLISLIACGGSMPMKILLPSRQFIIKKQQTDGGWSKVDFQNYGALTRITCIALEALHAIGESSDAVPIQNGIKWLNITQNLDGGWGNKSKDNESDVISTAYALRILASIQSLDSKSISNARKWLLTNCNHNFSWSERQNQNGTLAHTSCAVEALVSCRTETSELRNSINWLINNIKEPDKNTILDEHYLLGDQNGIPKYLQWTQVPLERSLIALLKIGESVNTPLIVQVVEKIINQQINGEYWPGNSPQKAPGWATKEAVISLRLYLDYLESYLFDAIPKEVSQLHEKLDCHNKRIVELERQIKNKQIKQIAIKIWENLKKPIIWVPILVSSVLLLTRYLSLLPESWQTWFTGLGGTAAILGIIVFIREMIRSKKQE
jgi:hypothetical protein